MKQMYQAEIHCHTKESSKCGEISAKDLVGMYKDKDYSTIVITDHCSKSNLDHFGKNTWKEQVDCLYQGYHIAKEQAKQLGITVLLGVEVSLISTDSDYLIYGMEQSFLYQHEKIYENTIEQLYQLCKEKGYLLVQAHPFRDDILLAPLEYIDGVEVFNGCQAETSRNEQALEYANQTDKIQTSGSDFHEKIDLAQGGIRTDEKIQTIEQLVQILKENKYDLKGGKR